MLFNPSPDHLKSFNPLKSFVCWYSFLFSSVSSVQICCTWKRCNFFLSRRKECSFFSVRPVFEQRCLKQCILTTLEKFCTEARSQDSLHLTVALAGRVVVEKGTFLGFLSVFFFVFVVGSAFGSF